MGERARIDTKMRKKNRTWKAIMRFSMCGSTLDANMLTRKPTTRTAQYNMVPCHRSRTYSGQLRVSSPWMRVPAPKGADAVKNSHASTVSQPETQLHAARVREELSWATKRYCPPAVGYLDVRIIRVAVAQTETSGGQLHRCQLAQRHSGAQVAEEGYRKFFFSVWDQAKHWVVFIRINPYTKETGPPLTSPEPIVLQAVSHVAMRDTARERVERVLKFCLTWIIQTSLATLYRRIDTKAMCPCATHLYILGFLNFYNAQVSDTVLVTLLATGFNLMVVAAGDAPFDTAIHD